MKFARDYSFILNTINSCKNIEQLNTATRWGLETIDKYTEELYAPNESGKEKLKKVITYQATEREKALRGMNEHIL